MLQVVRTRALTTMIVSLPLMDFEVFQIAGRSIVLPYVTVAILGATLLRGGLLLDFCYRDRALPFLLMWFAWAAGTSGLAILQSETPGLAPSNVTQLASLGIMVGHYVIIGAALGGLTCDQFSRAVRLFIWTGVAGAVLTFYQVGSVLLGVPYADLLRTSNLYHHINTLNWHGGGSWIALPRAYGAAPEPTFWAGFLVIALAFALGHSTVRKPRSWVAPALIGAALVCTFARSVVPSLAVLAACMLVVWADARATRWVAPGVVGLAFAATIWPALLSDRWLATLGDHSAIERLSSTVTGLRILGDHPFLGIGVGSVPFFVENYIYVVDGRAGIGFVHLYSFLAHLLATTGIVGALLFGGFLVEVGRRSAWALAVNPRQLSADGRSVFFAFSCLAIYWVGTAAFNLSFLWYSLAMAATIPVRRDVG